jgi:chorismate mutase/prephenate dehydratase
MSDDLQKALAGVRAEIDGIDGELLRLLNQRARCAQKVGEIKAEHGEAGHIYRPEREAQVLRRLQDANPGPLPGENITFFFREVMSACLSLEAAARHCLPWPARHLFGVGGDQAFRPCCPFIAAVVD